MVISQGEIWWADLPAPARFGPGFRRPIVVVQGDALNRSRIATVVCVPLTSNLKWALASGNLHLRARHTGLPKDSVVNVSRIVSIDKDLLSERTGKLPPSNLQLVLAGIDTILGNWQPKVSVAQLLGPQSDPAKTNMLLRNQTLLAELYSVDCL